MRENLFAKFAREFSETLWGKWEADVKKSSQKRESREIEPGPETDRKVAEAIGLVYEKRPHPNAHGRRVLCAEPTGWWDGEEYVDYQTPPYSTDLNVAFEATEKVGLFKDLLLGRVYHSGGSEPCWYFQNHFFHGQTVPGEYPTPSLALCAAILKLKEEP